MPEGVLVEHSEFTADVMLATGRLSTVYVESIHWLETSWKWPIGYSPVVESFWTKDPNDNRFPLMHVASRLHRVARGVDKVAAVGAHVLTMTNIVGQVMHRYSRAGQAHEDLDTGELSYPHTYHPFEKIRDISQGLIASSALPHSVEDAYDSLKMLFLGPAEEGYYQINNDGTLGSRLINGTLKRNQLKSS